MCVFLAYLFQPPAGRSYVYNIRAIIHRPLLIPYRDRVSRDTANALGLTYTRTRVYNRTARELEHRGYTGLSRSSFTGDTRKRRKTRKMRALCSSSERAERLHFRRKNNDLSTYGRERKNKGENPGDLWYNRSNRSFCEWQYFRYVAPRRCCKWPQLYPFPDAKRFTRRKKIYISRKYQGFAQFDFQERTFFM